MSAELQVIAKDDCLLDVDESAWERLVEIRGGCRCHLSPPCFACSEPVSEQDLNRFGYTYGSAGQEGGAA